MSIDEIIKFTVSSLSFSEIELRIKYIEELGYKYSVHPPIRGGHIYKEFKDYDYDRYQFDNNELWKIVWQVFDSLIRINLR